MIRVVEVQQTCGGCPSQWEGQTDDGRAVYARYRYGKLWVGLSEPGGTVDDAVVATIEKRSTVHKIIGDEYDGWMEYDELQEHTAGVIEWPTDG